MGAHRDRFPGPYLSRGFLGIRDRGGGVGRQVRGECGHRGLRQLGGAQGPGVEGVEVCDIGPQAGLSEVQGEYGG